MTDHSFERRPHGLTSRRGGADPLTLDVAFLAPGIVRIMAGPDAAVPEEASWAVLPEVGQARVPASCTETDGAVTLATALLSVTVERATLAVTVRDTSGRILCADHPRDALRFDDPGYRVRKHAPPGERYYGLGDKPGPLEKRGHAYEMWNTDAYGFQEAWDPLYKTVPFLLAVRDDCAWGLFVDTTHRSAFDLAVTSRDALCFSAADGPLRYVVIAGPGPKDVLERYTALVGRIALPPLWALGYGQCRYSYETQAEAEAIVHAHRTHAVPLDALWLDIGFQDRNRPFTIDTAAYPDLAGMVAEFSGNGVHTVVITDLHIAHLPGDNSTPYESGIAGDHYVKNPDGSIFVGKVWPGTSVFPDFTREATRAWWGSLYGEFATGFGIAGFWNDMNEPAVFGGPGHTMPLDVVHRIEEPGFSPRQAAHAEIHNVYGMQNARATHDGLLALAPDRRPFVLTRASYAGGHRHAATWTGDNSSTENHLRLSTPQLLSLGLSGFALAGCDIGGFRGAPSPELLTRWTALGAFNPLFRNHTDNGTLAQEVWVHGDAHLARRRAAIERRYRLMPYLYTAIEETSRTGVPMMRPMFLEFSDRRFAAEEACFMLGGALLVAPTPETAAPERRVRLPTACDWYAYDTGLRAEPSADPNPDLLDTVGVANASCEVAVFVRGGSILPVQQVLRSTGERPTEPLRLHVYPDRDGRAEGSVYADDGTSFAYRRGVFFRQGFSWDGERLVAATPDGTFPCPWPGIEYVLHDGRSPATGTRDDGAPGGGAQGVRIA